MAAPSIPGSLTLAVNRWSPFDDTIRVEGVDLSGATLLMQVRLYRDAPGDPLINLATIAAPAQGLSVSIDNSAVVPTSIIRIIINETTLEGLLVFPASGAEANADVSLKWDMLISAPGMKKARWFEGDFVIRAGVTQA